jgi:hypothetical protein
MTIITTYDISTTGGIFPRVMEKTSKNMIYASYGVQE